VPQLRWAPEEGVLCRRHRLQGLRLLPQRQPRLLLEQQPRVVEVVQLLLVVDQLLVVDGFRIVFEQLRIVVERLRIVVERLRIVVERLFLQLRRIRPARRPCCPEDGRVFGVSGPATVLAVTPLPA